jgi:hypothetical protein
MKQQPLPLPEFEGCEVDPPKPIEKPPFKYIEVEVTRKQFSTVYLKVPQEFDTNSIKRKGDILVQACKKTLGDFDWETPFMDDDVEWQSIKEVSEEEATAYQVYEVK